MVDNMFSPIGDCVPPMGATGGVVGEPGAALRCVCELKFEMIELTRLIKALRKERKELPRTRDSAIPGAPFFLPG